MATPTRGYDDFLISNCARLLQGREGELRERRAAGADEHLRQRRPTRRSRSTSGRTTAARRGQDACNTVDLSTYSYPNNLIMPGSTGTNWWKAVFGTGKVTDANLQVSRRQPGEHLRRLLQLFDQNGTARYNEFKRGTVRANTEFRRSRLTFGENLGDRRSSARTAARRDDAFGENTIIGKNILMQPVVPVCDIAGNFASGKALTFGNNTNPLKIAYEARDNLTKNNRVFGNVFAGYAILPTLAVRSRFGFNVDQGSFTATTLRPPRKTPSDVHQLDRREHAAEQRLDVEQHGDVRVHLRDRAPSTCSPARRRTPATSAGSTASLANLLNPAVDFRYHPGRPRRREDEERHERRQRVRAALAVRQGGLQLRRSLHRQRHPAARRLVALRQGQPVGNFPGVRSRLAPHQRVVPRRRTTGCPTR